MEQLNGILPLVLMIPIFYFFFIRPQQQEAKKKKEMLKNLKNGDKVLTQAGMYGVVTAVSDDAITLKVADGVKIDFSRPSITEKVVKD
ncbi:MAG: preprotein translocase subunit YajC [Fibrobacterales bacterium]